MTRRSLQWPLLFALVSMCSAPSTGQILPCTTFTQGIGGSLHGFVPFTPDSAWNLNIANAPADPNSGAILTFIGVGTHLHPDFGASVYEGSVIGVPYIVVPGNQPMVNIILGAYANESDLGPMPIPRNAPIQGYPNPGDNDRHVIVLDKGNCWEYDLYHAYLQTDGSWYADSAAVWDMLADGQRPYTWTSSNAAGTAEFPGLVRYDEVASGTIRHALAYTLRYTKQAFTPPATHWAPNSNDGRAAPMGMRMRLRAAFDISGFPPDMQVILTALKNYGMILVDNGGPLFLSGAPDLHWNDAHINLLKNLSVIDFEVVKIDPLYTQQNLPQGPNPTINSFSATPSRGAGQPVTLRWDVADHEYYSVYPTVGVVRGTRVTVYPTQTTVYTLLATNQFGRAAASVTVTVPQ